LAERKQPKKKKNKETAKKKKQSGPAWRSWARRLAYAFFSLVLAVILGGVVTTLLLYNYFSQDLPPTDSLKNYRPKTVTFFYADDGRVIGEFSHERRLVVPLAKIPKHVQQAFIAAEDANFYHHKGIDLQSIARAFIKNVEAGRIVQGGSTITQQITRSFLLSPEKTYTRKLREAILAYRIDRNLTKDEILHLYLNQIYLGHGAYGVESAAELYFNKHVGQLTLGEAALLAGLPQAPSRYSPFSRPKAARSRQKYTLKRMLAVGFISQKQTGEALAEKLEFYNRPNVNLVHTPYFTEHVRRLLEKKYGEDRLYNDGLRVYTTVNIDMQAEARKAVKRGLREFTKRHSYRGPLQQLPQAQVKAFTAKQVRSLDKKPLKAGAWIKAVVTEVQAKVRALKIRVGRHDGLIKRKDLQWVLAHGKRIKKLFAPGDVIYVQAIERDEKTGVWTFSLEQAPQVQSALICLDLVTGAVKAMIGGRDFLESQFNRAVQSRRQPGSAFKPVIYTAAMDSGFTPGSIIIDSPIVYDDFTHMRRWKPRNYDAKFHGPTDLYTALTRSRNVITIKLLSKIGVLRAIEYARKMGIRSPLAENLSLALGSSGVSLSELVSAYSVFPNLGERVEPMYITRIEDRDGRVIEEFQPVRVESIAPDTACVIRTMLQGVVARGTGIRVKPLGRPVGGKTGTTNDLADAWFIGFTPGYITGVWVGLDKMKRMGWGESGGRAAAPVFLYYMQSILAGKPVRDFDTPPGVTFVSSGAAQICYKTGTVGTGISEVDKTGQDDLLKSELDEKDL